MTKALCRASFERWWKRTRSRCWPEDIFRAGWVAGRKAEKAEMNRKNVVMSKGPVYVIFDMEGATIQFAIPKKGERYMKYDYIPSESQIILDQEYANVWG